MRRISHAIIAMGMASTLCIFLGHLSEVIFISAVVSVILSVFDSRFVDSISFWAVSIPFMLISPQNSMVQSVFIGFSTHILCALFEGKLHLTPQIPVRLRVDVNEMRLDFGFAMVLISAIVIV